MQSRNTIAVNTLAALGYPLPAIRKALHKLNGVSHAALSRRLGVSRPTVTATVEGTRGGFAVRAAIAKEFNVPMEVLFNDAVEQASNENTD